MKTPFAALLIAASMVLSPLAMSADDAFGSTQQDIDDEESDFYMPFLLFFLWLAHGIDSEAS